MTALDDVDHFFSDMIRKPSVHSLNKDLLYIVFRHHDGIKQSYYSDEEIEKFGKVISGNINPYLSEDSQLDILTNALSICDMYDALLDTKRDYRKSSFNKYFALFLLYGEMKRDKFFPDITKDFIKFIINTEDFEEDYPFNVITDPDLIYEIIELLYNNFEITKEKEWDFDKFLYINIDEFKEFILSRDNKLLELLIVEWQHYSDMRENLMYDSFTDSLIQADLIQENHLILDEEKKKTFKMLYDFYYSYASTFKQSMLIDYLIDTVIEHNLDDTAKQKLIEILKRSDVKNRKDVEKSFIKDGYNRRDLFEVFKNYDEEILINELNDFLLRKGR